MHSCPTIAVHLHLYYIDMWDTIRTYLQNLEDYPYHLYVTIVNEHPQLAAEIKSFHPDSTIWVVDNRGYDVGPFVDFLNRIDLDEYDIIIKFHTKRTMPKGHFCHCRRCIWGTWWRTLLYDAILGSKEQVKQNIETFASNPAVGIIGSQYCTIDASKEDPKMIEALKACLNHMGIDYEPRGYFIAGTVFAVRSSILKPLKEKYTIDDFEPAAQSGDNGTLAHVMERAFAMVTYANGYSICGAKRNQYFEIISFWVSVWFYIKCFARVIRPYIFHVKKTRRNHLIVKLFKIPVWYSNLSDSSTDVQDRH